MSFNSIEYRKTYISSSYTILYIIEEIVTLMQYTSREIGGLFEDTVLMPENVLRCTTGDKTRGW